MLQQVSPNTLHPDFTPSLHVRCFQNSEFLHLLFLKQPEGRGSGPVYAQQTRTRQGVLPWMVEQNDLNITCSDAKKISTRYFQC
jgi:hypothetical protein